MKSRMAATHSIAKFALSNEAKVAMNIIFAAFVVRVLQIHFPSLVVNNQVIYVVVVLRVSNATRCG